jgi:hypothetical protein
VVILLVAAACRRDPDRPVAPAETAGPSHSGAPDPDPDADALRCAIDGDHALRGSCEVAFRAPGPLELRLSAPGEDDRVFRSEALAAAHRASFWGLLPDTGWTVTATNPDTGEVLDVPLRTGPLPAEFARMSVSVNDRGGSTLEAVAIAPTCPAFHVVVLDRRGRVVHWQDTQPDGFLGEVDALSLTDRGTLLVILGRSRVREYAFDGALLRELLRGRDFEDLVHHDVVGRFGATWVLGARRVSRGGTDWVVDRVLGFDGDGRSLGAVDLAGVVPWVEASWMREGYWSREFPGAVDLTHANAVSVDAAGDLWVSMRHQHAVARWDGDRSGDTFGRTTALLVGDPESPSRDRATGTVAGGPSAPFTGQHDAHLLDDGDFLLFDNGWLRDRPAEASRYRWSEATGSLSWVESWAVARTCPVMGAARALPDDHVLATCAGQALLREHTPGAAAPTWEASVTCGGLPSVFAEGVPLALPTR